MPAALTFRRSQRLTHARQFQAVYAGRVSRAGGPLVVHIAPNGLTFVRLGLSVGKKVGSAVDRNRAKRIVRDAFRLEQRRLPTGFDLIVGVRATRGFAGLELQEIRHLLVELVQDAARAWERKAP